MHSVFALVVFLPDALRDDSDLGSCLVVWAHAKFAKGAERPHGAWPSEVGFALHGPRSCSHSRAERTEGVAGDGPKANGVTCSRGQRGTDIGGQMPGIGAGERMV
jgi:hypothetical protein